MTQIDYTPFVERMINRYEGGYGWDRNDPGGPTKYGITCYDLAEFMHQTMDSMARWAPIVKAMTLGTADQIYAQKYATACQFDALQAGADCTVIDFGVNSGPYRAIWYAQQIVGVAQDGVLGPLTLAAINAMDPANFVNQLCDARLVFLESLAIWKNFGNGWAARIRDLRAYSIGLLQVPTPLMVARMSRPVPKLHRIHKAFAKGYHPEDLPKLTHQW